MKVKDIEYNHEALNVFGPNDLYRKCHKELVEDFELTYSDMMEVEIGEAPAQYLIDAHQSNKTNLLVAFVSGHLNAFNPASKFFVKFDVLSGGNREVKEEKSALSGLILPDHCR